MGKGASGFDQLKRRAVKMACAEPISEPTSRLSIQTPKAMRPKRLNLDRILPKTPSRETDESSSLPIVVVEHPAEVFPASDTADRREALRRLDQFVLDPLMVAALPIVFHESG